MRISWAVLTALGAMLAMTSCVAGSGPGGSALASLKRPANADSYSAFLVARFASLTNDPRTALEHYAVALKSSGGETEIAERAVFAALLSGDFDEAERMAQAATGGGPSGSALVRLTRAVAAIRDNRPAKAAGLLEGGDFGPFNQMMAANLRAWTALETDGPEAARSLLLQAAVDDALLDSVTLYMLGLVDLAAGEDERALATLETVWAEGPRLAVATEAHVRLLSQRGNTARALSILQTFRAEIGPNPALETLRVRLDAGEVLEIDRLDLREGAAMSIYAPAAALSAQTRGDLAGVYFAMALALDPELDIARTLWADALDEAGRRGDALAILRKVRPDSPFYATARGQMAWALRREMRNDEALEVASQALAARPDRDLRVQLADLFTSLQRDGEAEALLNKIIAGDEQARRPDWRLYLARGAARERLGRWPEAETDLQRARALSPDNPDILNHLGYGWIDRGLNLPQAIRLIERAVDLRPNSGQIVDSLGWAHYRLGEYSRAVVHLERAVEIEPGDAVINDHLGDAYWRVGRRLEAHFQWKRALGLGPDPALAAALHRKLAEGLPEDTRLVLDRSASRQAPPQ